MIATVASTSLEENDRFVSEALKSSGFVMLFLWNFSLACVALARVFPVYNSRLDPLIVRDETEISSPFIFDHSRRIGLINA